MGTLLELMVEGGVQAASTGYAGTYVHCLRYCGASKLGVLTIVHLTMAVRAQGNGILDSVVTTFG